MSGEATCRNARRSRADDGRSFIRRASRVPSTGEAAAKLLFFGVAWARGTRTPRTPGTKGQPEPYLFGYRERVTTRTFGRLLYL